MNKQPSRIGLYLVLVIALVAGYFYLNNQVVSQSNRNHSKRVILYFLFFLPFLRITQFASLPFLAYLYALYHRSLHLLTGNSNHFIKNLIIITGISINFAQHFTKISPRTLLQIYAPDKKPKTIKKRRIPSLLL